MNNSSFIGLIQNAAVLLAMGLLFDLSMVKRRPSETWLWQIVYGLILGAMGVLLMLTPWTLVPGIIFDTRTVLLGTSGLFFGVIPTLIAMGISAVYRYSLGGGAVWMGISTIISSGLIGIIWRSQRKNNLETISAKELYLFGWVIHVVMLLCAFVMPLERAITVLKAISVPVILIYPPTTMLLGILMINRLTRLRITEESIQSASWMKSVVELLQNPTQSIAELLDQSLSEIIRLTGSKYGYLFNYSEEEQCFRLNTFSKNALLENNIQTYPQDYRFSDTGLLGETIRQRQAIIINDLAADHPAKKGIPSGHIPIQNYLAVPVFCEGKIVAVVGVANKDGDYNERDVL
ncbi:MAG: LytS/YhcK type 5TM receptor domain-containing protein, partial [Anaerolineales bacterium]